MKRFWTRLVAPMVAGILAGGCFSGRSSGASGSSDYEPPTGSVMDLDGNKIFDSLDRLLATMGDSDKLPVLVMANSESDLPAIEKAAGGMQVRYRYKVVPAIAATLTKSQIEALAREPGVNHIEHDAEVHALQGSTDFFGATKARQDFGVTGNHDGQAGYTKNDIVVAIIDTGIDSAHVDLNNGKVIAWNDWVNNKPAPYDDHGHGTHVSGIVAGTGTGDPNYTGVAPGAALIGLKVLDQNGSGSLSNVAAAVDWAVQHKNDYNIRVISMSRREITRMANRRPCKGRFFALEGGIGHGPAEALL